MVPEPVRQSIRPLSHCLWSDPQVIAGRALNLDACDCPHCPWWCVSLSPQGAIMASTRSKTASKYKKTKASSCEDTGSVLTVKSRYKTCLTGWALYELLTVVQFSGILDGSMLAYPLQRAISNGGIKSHSEAGQVSNPIT
ncbi:conserved hypothetical protein [Ricinus communis]|uniref:Uncharacterized protein n=1 Tax=Ricinus communis TaxID=3988 RepID=B9SUE4_RICCO|nr:conserved hypothetical protein [Ricinus communis]